MTTTDTDWAETLGAHVRGDWSDRTYNCTGCTQRYEQEGQARFDALGRDATREELVEFRNGYSKVSHPGWNLAEYNAHLAAIIAGKVADERAGALESAAQEAKVRGDIGRTGCIEVWDWLTIRAGEERASS